MAKGPSGENLHAAVYFAFSKKNKKPRVGMWKCLAAAQLTSFIPVSGNIALGKAKWPDCSSVRLFVQGEATQTENPFFCFFSPVFAV